MSCLHTGNGMVIIVTRHATKAMSEQQSTPQAGTSAKPYNPPVYKAHVLDKSTGIVHIINVSNSRETIHEAILELVIHCGFMGQMRVLKAETLSGSYLWSCDEQP